MSVFTFTVYADYYQFYLGDSTFAADTGAPDFWSPEALGRKLAVAPPGLIGVATVHDDNVQVTGELASVSPGNAGARWDRVVEASLEVPSGRLAIG